LVLFRLHPLIKYVNFTKPSMVSSKLLKHGSLDYLIFCWNLDSRGLWDTSLFIYLHGYVQVYMLVYVDDIIITGTHPAVISTLILKLQ
jgi:hypothetical protein